MIILFLLFGSFVALKIFAMIKIKPGNTFDIYFGVPGCGKTTFAAWLSKKNIKKQKRVLSNVPIKGTYKVVKDDIGHVLIQDCHLILDEAGIDFNNRNFKTFTPEQTYFFKFHRHYNVDISMFSQSVDVDIKLRNLSKRYYLVSKSFIPFCIKRKLISKKIGIDRMTKQMIDEYYFPLFGTRLIFIPKLWKMFDSYDFKELPEKNWEQY